MIIQLSGRVRFAFCALCALVWDSNTRAETARIELRVLATTNLSDEQFLTGAKNDSLINIGAELGLPARSTARVPAIVLVH
jgi:hypothetical protein